MEKGLRWIFISVKRIERESERVVVVSVFILLGFDWFCFGSCDRGCVFVCLF